MFLPYCYKRLLSSNFGKKNEHYKDNGLIGKVMKKQLKILKYQFKKQHTPNPSQNASRRYCNWCNPKAAIFLFLAQKNQRYTFLTS